MWSFTTVQRTFSCQSEFDVGTVRLSLQEIHTQDFAFVIIRSNISFVHDGLPYGFLCPQNARPPQRPWRLRCAAARSQSLRISQQDSRSFPSAKVQFIVSVTETTIRWHLLRTAAVSRVTQEPECITFLSDALVYRRHCTQSCTRCCYISRFFWSFWKKLHVSAVIFYDIITLKII